MEIYEFAIQMERDGEKYYRDLIQKSSSAGLQKIFGLLADEEVRHRKLIEDLRQRTVASSESSRILQNVRNIFITMNDEIPAWGALSREAVNAFRKALDIEEMSKKFYLQKSDEAQDGQTKAVLNLLAAEEANHVRIMENIVEFVSRAEPGNWLENAEWHHLDEY